MKVSLTTELEKFVQDKVASGLYYSASEVIREGLRLLKEQDALKEYRLHELRQEIKKGIEQIERGDYTEYDRDSLKDLAQQIKSKGHKRKVAQDGIK